MTVVFDASSALAGSDDNNGNGNTNFRQLYAPAALGAATGNQIRLTLLFGTAEPTEAGAVDAVWVGQKTTTTIGSASTDSIFTGNQVQVLFSGSGSVNGSAAGVVVSDWVTLGENWDPTKGYMVAWHGGSGKNVNISFAAVANTSQALNTVAGASTASSTNGSMNFGNTGDSGLISKIEIQAGGATFIAAPNKNILQAVKRASYW